MKAAGRAVVVGGGIAGLLAALVLAERRRVPVTLIEREAELGGLLRSFDYGAHGRFDYGMHNMFETGVAALDELLWGLLPESEWQVFEGAKRDLAGLFYRGRLQENSLYMDLRPLPAAQRGRCLDELLAAAKQPTKPAANAHEHARARFGATIADEAVAPSLAKLFRRPAAELGVMATRLTSMDRVVLLDEAEMRARMDDDALRARVAFPEQRRLPASRASGRRGFYPKRYGMHRVVEAIEARLKRAGVEILRGTTLKTLHIRDGRVAALECQDGKAARRIEPVERLCWTTGFPGLAPLLGAMPAGLGFDRPLKTVVVNFLLRKPPEMGDLYYFYCYDEGFGTLRVTNYGGYCDGAARAAGHPVCVELLEPDDGKLDPVKLEAKARSELERFGVLRGSNEATFGRAEILASGFPLPTARNLAAMDRMREAVAARRLTNLTVLGILAEPELFFQRDVAKHVFTSLEAA